MAISLETVKWALSAGTTRTADGQQLRNLLLFAPKSRPISISHQRPPTRNHSTITRNVALIAAPSSLRHERSLALNPHSPLNLNQLDESSDYQRSALYAQVERLNYKRWLRSIGATREDGKLTKRNHVTVWYVVFRTRP